MVSPLFSGAGARATRAVPSARLFIALWPDASTQDALHAEAARFAALGRRLSARNLHVTLAFLGNVPLRRVEAITGLMRDAGPAACEFTLEHFGYFAQSGVLWAAPVATPVAVAAYQQRLTAALGAAGLRVEKRAFRLHVSLLRDAARPAPEQLNVPLNIPWRVRDIALVGSEPAAGGSRYVVLSRVPAPG